MLPPPPRLFAPKADIRVENNVILVVKDVPKLDSPTAVAYLQTSLKAGF
jgi:hypothetical protein